MRTERFTWGILFCLLVWMGVACSPSVRRWEGLAGESQCQPSHTIPSKHPEWNDIFKKEDPITPNGCMQIMQGVKVTETVLVRFASDGVIHGLDEETGTYSVPPTITVPPKEDNVLHRFRVYIFSATLPKADREKLCKEDMDDASYQCFGDTKANCSLYMEFRPQTPGVPLQTGTIDNDENIGCKAFFRSKSTESQGEFTEDASSEIIPPTEVSENPTEHTAEWVPESSSPEKVPEPAEENQRESTPEDAGPTESLPDAQCKNGQSRPCYTGPPGTQNRAPCKAGKQYCSNGKWWNCVGEVTPKPEKCGNKVDENCDGSINENCNTGKWLKFAGTDKIDRVYDMATDAKGDIYITGYIEGKKTKFGSNLVTGLKDKKDVFVAKLNVKGEWQWVVAAGSLGNDEGRGITVSPAGEIFVTGSYNGKATFGSDVLSSKNASGFPGARDIFVAKLNNKGKWLWAKGVGGSGDDRGYSIDATKNFIAVAGFYQNYVKFGKHQLSSQSTGADIFVARLDHQGTWIWVHAFHQRNLNLDDKGENERLTVKMDHTNLTYIAGNFEKKIVFGSRTLSQVQGQTGRDIFIAKLTNTGKGLTWFHKLGSTKDDRVSDLVLDHKGSLYVTGHYNGTIKLLPTLSTKAKSGTKGNDIFIIKIKAIDGDYQTIWNPGNSLTGTIDQQGESIAVDSNGSLYVTGRFKKLGLFGTKKILSNGGAGNYDFFLAKVSPKGVWQTIIHGGSALGDEGMTVAVDRNNIPIFAGMIAGQTSTTPFVCSIFSKSHVYDPLVGGTSDLFVGRNLFAK